MASRERTTDFGRPETAILPILVGHEQGPVDVLAGMLTAHPSLAVVRHAGFAPKLAAQRELYELKRGFATERFLAHLLEESPPAGWDRSEDALRERLFERQPRSVAEAIRAFFSILAGREAKPRCAAEVGRASLPGLVSLAEILPEARLLHLVQDPRSPTDPTRTGGTHAHNAATHALEWGDHVESVRAAVVNRSDAYLEVRYEDLVRSPEQELERVLRFLALDASSELVSELGRVVQNEHERGAGLDGSGGTSATTPSEGAKIVESLVGDLLHELGYAVGPGVATDALSTVPGGKTYLSPREIRQLRGRKVDSDRAAATALGRVAALEGRLRKAERRMQKAKGQRGDAVDGAERAARLREPRPGVRSRLYRALWRGAPGRADPSRLLAGAPSADIRTSAAPAAPAPHPSAEDLGDLEPLAAPPCPAGWRTGPPDFVGVGAARCGTTRWFELIAAHPAVVRTPERKEIHFFDRFHDGSFTEADVDAYHRHFPRPPDSTVGEWSPTYMFDYWTPQLLARAAPGAKILVLLRDPVERYHSHLGLRRRRKRADLNACDHNVLVHTSSYLRQVERLLHYFDRSSVLVLQHERCRDDPGTELARSYNFLRLPEATFQPQELLDRRNASAVKPSLARSLRDELVDFFEEEVKALASLLPEIDLDLWPNFRHLKTGDLS